MGSSMGAGSMGSSMGAGSMGSSMGAGSAAGSAGRTGLGTSSPFRSDLMSAFGTSTSPSAVSMMTVSPLSR